MTRPATKWRIEFIGTNLCSHDPGGANRLVKFMKTVTWQRATEQGAHKIAEATARISRMEGMEGHARITDIRLEKYFPDQNFDLSAS